MASSCIRAVSWSRSRGRIYYLFIGDGHFIGAIALLWALRRMPLLRDRPWRIAASFVLAHVLVVSALGGAVLERYLLPALPVVYIAFAHFVAGASDADAPADVRGARGLPDRREFPESALPVPVRE